MNRSSHGAGGSELERFLGYFSLIYPNLNDCFGYATADTQRLYLDDPGEGANTDTLIRAFREFDFDGILAYCAKVRKQEPIKELRTPAYEAAMDALAEWEYEDD